MKKVLALILALCLCLCFAACGDKPAENPSDNDNPAPAATPAPPAPADTNAPDDKPSEPAPADEQKTVGIAMPTQSLERWNRDGAYLDEQFKAAGYETIVTYSDDKSEQQVNDIQNMLAQGVDLLVIAAIDGNALNTVMNDAGAAGVPVIAYDRLIMNDNVS